MNESELPIFELPLVLLPGERVPLHIFEERYKRMIGRSLERGRALRHRPSRRRRRPLDRLHRPRRGGARAASTTASWTSSSAARPLQGARPLRVRGLPRRRGRRHRRASGIAERRDRRRGGARGLRRARRARDGRAPRPRGARGRLGLRDRRAHRAARRHEADAARDARRGRAPGAARPTRCAPSTAPSSRARSSPTRPLERPRRFRKRHLRGRWRPQHPTRLQAATRKRGLATARGDRRPRGSPPPESSPVAGSRTTAWTPPK